MRSELSATNAHHQEKGDESTDSPDEICSCVEAFTDHEALTTAVAAPAADACSARSYQGLYGGFDSRLCGFVVSPLPVVANVRF